jgi:hypothetical protein
MSKIVELEIITDFLGAAIFYRIDIEELSHGNGNEYLVTSIYDSKNVQIGGAYYDTLPCFRDLWRDVKDNCEGKLIDVEISYSIAE